MADRTFWQSMWALTMLAAAALGGLLLLMLIIAYFADLTIVDDASSAAVDYESRSISIVISEEPPQMDSTRATDAVSGMLLGHLMEGLLRYDGEGNLQPGVAESWTVTPEGAVFKLRDNARWSDGEPVTAHDFVFSWRTALAPETASLYAFIMYPIKHAEAINLGDMPSDQLGVVAEDDLTLRVEFERPLAFFDRLVAFTTYYPIREDFYLARDGRYGADAEDLLFNGAFVMTKWVHGAEVALEKNPYYWNKDSIWLNRINVPFITPDSNTQLNLFKDGKVAMVQLSPDTLKNAVQNRWPIRRFAEGTVFFIEFNHRPERLTRNLNLRKALYYATDTAELVYRVIKLPGFLPGASLFPTWLRGEHDYLRREYPVPAHPVNVTRAREHLELARQELGLDEFPPLVLLVGDTPTSLKQAEYFQNTFKRHLGLEVRIDAQIFKQRLEKMTLGQFDMVAAGWAPDFDDPLTYGDLFASWNKNNRGYFRSDALDAQVRIAQGSLNQNERMRAFGEIQRILLEEVAIIPNYERGRVFVADPSLEGLIRRTIGPDPDYSRARIRED
ncbi:MAG: peptide ABC transporter substrate-binding protein [Gammaproteobacteria bacterium]|nr:peptide ABC transporter substrate-binding protein [Gammaproteobacteria bacterium]